MFYLKKVEYLLDFKRIIMRKLILGIADGRVITSIIPDIESVNYGRGVGYDIIEHVPPKNIGEISATNIRKKLFGE